MIERLEITGYRGIARGDLPSLAPLTVLVGPNNSGKSSVLEALYLAGAAGDGAAIARIGTRRGWIGLASLPAWLRSGQALLRWRAGDSEVLLTLSARGERVESSGPLISRAGYATFAESRGWASNSSSVQSIEELPAFIEPQAIGLDPALLDEAVSRADLVGGREDLLALLRPLLPGLRDMRILQAGSRYSLHVEDGSGPPWPAAVAGDGFKKLLVLASKIAADKSGLILVEEPETYLHVGAYAQVARLFWQTINTGGPRQVVATTHSLEMLDAIFGAPEAQL